MEESTYYWLEAFVIIFGIAIIVVGVWYHINYGKFKPKIEVFSDGSARMIFLAYQNVVKSKWCVLMLNIRLVIQLHLMEIIM